MELQDIPIERHPLEPFMPRKARLLILGSFPPKKERWSMDFFYPNWINDMWRIWGLVFFGDREHFHASGQKRFDKDRCAAFAAQQGIAMYDAACEVRRIRDNASDRFLDVVKVTDINNLLNEIPDCQAIVTTGQKASEIVAATFGCGIPETGSFIEISACDGVRKLRFWRMPSSSRAYPLALEKKALHYRRLFSKEIGNLYDNESINYGEISE